VLAPSSTPGMVISSTTVLLLVLKIIIEMEKNFYFLKVGIEHTYIFNEINLYSIIYANYY
jgi:hypothetical protein